MIEHEKNSSLSDEERKQFMAEMMPILEKNSMEEIEMALQQLILKQLKNNL